MFSYILRSWYVSGGRYVASVSPLLWLAAVDACVASVLEKVLYKENRQSIRMVGFELLLYFLEAVLAAPFWSLFLLLKVGTPDEGQVDVFGAALDLEVFLPQYKSVQLKTKVLQGTCQLQLRRG